MRDNGVGSLRGSWCGSCSKRGPLQNGCKAVSVLTASVRVHGSPLWSVLAPNAACSAFREGCGRILLLQLGWCGRLCGCLGWVFEVCRSGGGRHILVAAYTRMVMIHTRLTCCPRHCAVTVGFVPSHLSLQVAASGTYIFTHIHAHAALGQAVLCVLLPCVPECSSAR